MKTNHDKPAVLAQHPSIGGGEGYTPEDPVTIDDADWIVRDTAKFEQILTGLVAKGETVWIASEADLDITGIDIKRGVGIHLPKGVTIASDGATLRITESTNFAPLIDAADNCRVTGINFVAPETEWREYTDDGGWKREGNAIQITGDNVVVDNCFFRGWGHAGVKVGNDSSAKDAEIHHSTFVDNALQELGYGVTVWHGNPEIHHCYFDGNRHAVSGDGYQDCSYVGRDNITGPNSYLQVFDMHRGEEVSEDAGEQAGKSVEIRNNIIMRATAPDDGTLSSGVFLRGNPAEGGEIRYNRFGYAVDDSGPDGQRAIATNGNVVTDSNLFEGGDESATIGPQ